MAIIPDRVISGVHPTQAPAALEHWTRLGESLGLRTNLLLARKAGITIIPKVIGDEVLVKRLMTGDAYLANRFKAMRRYVAKKTVVRAGKSFISVSPYKKKHLVSTWRVRSATLEGTWVAAGNSNYTMQLY